MLNRRTFLRGSALIGCSIAAHPWLTTMTFASAPGDNLFVVIILRGALDGLDMLQPYGDPELKKLRRTISIGPDAGAFDLDGFYALHPVLEPLLPLWKSGELAFAQAVSTPYRDKRSHFDGQDLLEAGTGEDVGADQKIGGWLNRTLQALPNATSETAYSVGTDEMKILSGPEKYKSWAPNADLRLSAQGQLLLDHVYHDDPLFRDAAMDAGELTGQKIEKQAGPQAASKSLGLFAASRLNGETRIAAFSLAGFDSHANQKATLKRSLEQLSAAILGLKEGLGKNWDKTTVLAMTEFGRTARENGTAGTDHGTAGTLLMAGGAIKGGKVYGDWPGLAEGDLYQGRDLFPTRDVRAYSAWAMRNLFGLEAGLLDTTIFPGLDMGADPGFLA